MNKRKRNSVGILIITLVLVVILTGCSKEYVITFNTDGGSSVSSLKVGKDDKIVKPSDPTKEGYIFDGWYYNDKLFDFDTKITKDIVLEARWTIIEGKVTGVSLDIDEITLKPNGTHNLVVTILPDNANNKNVTWTSSDDSIVEVSKDGKIKALKKGSATITVTTEDGNYTAKCKVTVTDDIVNVTGVSINGQGTVKVGKTIKLTVVIKPNDASDKSVTWTSSNNAIATVDNNGTVKGIKKGKVTITVTTNDGKRIATKEVTVEENTTPSEPPKEENIKVESIKIKGGKEIYVGDTLNLTYEITPSNATNKKVTWTSSDNTIATVKDGVVKGIKSGEVTITVTTEDGQKTDSIKITIKEKEDVYVVYLKEEKQSGTGNVMQYSFRITKNGSNFTEYTGFVYNGRPHIKGKGFIDIDDLGDKGTKTATIFLDENTTVKASVVYES